MRASTVVLAAALTITGAAGAVGLARGSGDAVIAGSFSHDDERRAGPDSARVEAFFRSLHAADPMLCEMVADQLGNFWSSMGDDMIGSLADGARRWEPVRDSLAGRVTDAAARRRLLTALGDDDVCIRRTAAKMLGHTGELAEPALKEALRSSLPRVREAALLALGHAELPGSFDAVMDATRDPSPEVTAMATWALGEYEDARGFGRLNDLTRSGLARVRRAAAWGLGQLEDPRGVAALAPL
ncbi:MAG: HEAT repeat domain-containing protein, partial [Gemmatimonadales bacterium]|nr:HEAT repeat domain-containing protein [Gemmatimonadales bacterium]